MKAKAILADIANMIAKAEIWGTDGLSSVDAGVCVDLVGDIQNALDSYFDGMSEIEIKTWIDKQLKKLR